MSKIKYDKNLLQEICNRDKCIIDFDKIEKYNRDIKIEFICNCGIKYTKTICRLYKSCAYCKICTLNIKNEKSKQTCIDKYGVEHSSKSQEIKNKYKQTCLNKYGVENASQSQEVKVKIKQTCLDKYGVENAFQSQEVKDKSKQTCLDKYGVEYSMQSQEVKDKSKQSCLDKYGFKYASQSQDFKDKSKQTCIDKYGVEYAFQSQEVKDKSKKTCIDKYGVEYSTQNAEISEKQSKNSYKKKSFKFSCGNIIEVQGYEPFLLNYLIKLGYTYNDIIIKRTDVPEIWYKKNDGIHRYFCDIYIPKINTIYEVKSTWTYKKDIEDIHLKKQACINAGYLFELYVYDHKGIKQDL